MIQRFSHILWDAIKVYRSKGIQRVLEKIYGNICSSKIVRGERRFEQYTNIWHIVNKIRYTNPPDPYRPIWISPQNINTWNDEFRKEWGLGRVVGGDWDLLDNCEKLESLTIYNGLNQRFVEGLNWEETIYYKSAKDKFDKGINVAGYDSIEEYKNVRCDFVDDLYMSIRDEGYRPNFRAEHEVPQEDKRNSEWFWNQLEPLVVIGRDGTIHLSDGRHRFIIARILEVGEIPVNVLTRHQKWQQFRDMVSESDSVGSQLSHPDISNGVCD